MTPERQRGDRERAALVELIRECPWFVEILEVVAQDRSERSLGGSRGGSRPRLGLPLWPWLDAGQVRDVGVAFFDPEDLSRERDLAAEEALRERAPTVPWEAKNQAAVHLWYPRRFGLEVLAVNSTSEAVPTRPETATEVAARLNGNDIDVVAPLGLDDLLGGVWRRNPRRVTPEEYLARIERKRPQERWPDVVVHGPLGVAR
jgi:hypothetical protein